MSLNEWARKPMTEAEIERAKEVNDRSAPFADLAERVEADMSKDAQSFHVTRYVTGTDGKRSFYGHTTDKCDPSGCAASTDYYLPDAPQDTRVGDIVAQ